MKKSMIIGFAVLIIFIAIFMGSFLTSPIDKEALSETFIVDAIYYKDQGYVEIIFEDRSKKSNIVILEILGMSESFQKKYTTPTFVERVNFSNPPKYGWQIHPVTFVIDHPEFGKIGLKTEIHSIGEPAPTVIYSAISD